MKKVGTPSMQTQMHCSLTVIELVGHFDFPHLHDGGGQWRGGRGGRVTCDASNGLLEAPRFDLGKALAEAQEAVQGHLRLVVIIRLHPTPPTCRCTPLPLFWH